MYQFEQISEPLCTNLYRSATNMGFRFLLCEYFSTLHPARLHQPIQFRSNKCLVVSNGLRISGFDASLRSFEPCSFSLSPSSVAQLSICRSRCHSFCVIPEKIRFDAFHPSFDGSFRAFELFGFSPPTPHGSALNYPQTTPLRL